VIYPVSGVPVEVWCDMTGGGWTVIQRRQDGFENFYRPWNDYVNGFGSKTGEYWLGLETMRIMTTGASTLRIELETFGDVTPVSAFALYSTFVVGSSAFNYPLTVGGFSGNCGDSMAYHNGMPFTTYDNPHDYDYYYYYFGYYASNCAYMWKGGWWYNYCHESNLNGLYLGGANTAFSEGINWLHCWGFNYSLKTSVMKIRRNA
jgi:ficolin